MRRTWAPNALWAAAGAALRAEGGLLPARLDAEWFDFSTDDATVDPPRIGATVTVDEPGITGSFRIVELVRTIAGAEGIERVRGRLGSRPRDLLALLMPSERPSAGAALEPVAADAAAVRVAVSGGQAAPVLAISYPPGTAALRIEVPIPADPLPSPHDPSQDGPYGLAPVPVTDGRATVGVVTVTGLDSATGGETTYTVSSDELDDGTTEDTVAAGARRGEYRVYALPDGTVASARLAWTGVLQGAVASTGVLYDSAVNDMADFMVLGITVSLRILRISNIRATSGTTLVSRTDEATDWTEVEDTLTNTVTALTDGGFDIVAVSPGAGDRSVNYSFAARIGDGTMANPYQYLGPVTLTLAPDAPLADAFRRVTSEPDGNDGLPAATLYWEPV